MVKYFDCCRDKRFVDLWVSNPLAVAKNYPLYRGSMKNATLFLPSPKYRRPSFTEKFGSRMYQRPFDGSTHVERHILNRGETSGSVDSYIFKFGVR